LIELKNPCTNCNHSWSAGKGSGCESCCKEYEIYQTIKKSENEIESTFGTKLDELHIKFISIRNNLEPEEDILIREVFRFLKREIHI
jgi:hypothetical protein